MPNRSPIVGDQAGVGVGNTVGADTSKGSGQGLQVLLRVRGTLRWCPASN